ncbi:hypothetical protein M409DRAFT_22361 [Zasmidium cellare ATCC 36951]|uniref:Benzoate 4-monooxygenase cytochrome P450 n=1 Tax=Zasmidium cellare ATCC 36951 TaxID=1080233 RepID=A0A6A6CQ11_ZASCE|nr:uncharacterized protein M409DRAFT_22361 [Zasmidium cellare ATCC 36951]KAF2167556.1 hypothetical protein M409DRAFT_22361 [Zasmidium cellare ATCC 36951]
MDSVSGWFSYLSLAATASSLILAYVVSTIIYRLYFHPLAKYPGPLFARISTFPSYWHTLKQDRHIWLWRLQQQYGDTFRYRPDAVLINTPTAFRSIFGPKGNVRKSDYYRVWPRTAEVTSTWNVTDIPAHARKRRVMNQAFSEKALKSAEIFIHDNVDRWLDLLGDQGKTGTTSINMAHEINYLVFDILGDLCFGQSFGMIEPGSEMRYVPEVLATFLQLFHPIAFSPLAEWWVWAKPRGLDKILGYVSPPAVTNWEKFVASCLEKRTKVEHENRALIKPESEVRKDFFYYLFDAKDPETGTGYDLNELYGECELLIVAGSDTTSIVMSAMIFYLAKNPDVQTRLADEILSTFNAYNEIRGGSQIHSCRYLKAFIQEACRMAPPVGADPARQVLSGGTIIDGQYFPEGTKLSISCYRLSYSDDVFPEPFAFRPERWLPEHSSPERLAIQEQGFCSFLAGSRGCVGKNLAWLEMMLVISKLVYKYEVIQDPKDNLGGGAADGRIGRQNPDQYQTYDAFVALRDGPMVHLRPR